MTLHEMLSLLYTLLLSVEQLSPIVSKVCFVYTKSSLYIKPSAIFLNLSNNQNSFKCESHIAITSNNRITLITETPIYLFQFNRF